MSITTQQKSLAELLHHAKQGDGDSLERLLAGFRGYLQILSRNFYDRRLSRRLSSGDLVQDALLEAHRDFVQFNGTTLAEFSGWLRQILIRNAQRSIETHLVAAKRDIRRERTWQSLAGSASQSAGQLAALLADRGRGPASEAEHQETLVKLTQAIAELSNEHRCVILLRHLDGLEFSEVAKQMHRSSGAVRMLWLRGIEALRKRMEAQR